jgi:capsular exopolysaccharide synthesis family protein
MPERAAPFGDERTGAATYLQSLREHWLLILTLVVGAVAAAALYSFTAEERFEAEADLIVTPVSASDETFLGTSVLRESGVQSNSVLTAARLIRTPDVAEAVREELGQDVGRDELLAMVEVEPISQSSIVAIIATAGDAERAAEIANAFAEAVVEQRSELFQNDIDVKIDRLESRLDEIAGDERLSGEAAAIQERLSHLRALVGAQDPTIRVTSEALPPESPVWPRPMLTIAVALLAALLLGMGGALAIEFVNPRVDREDELEQTQRLPILARVPRLRGRLLSHYLSGEPLPGEAREAYRTLRASLAANPEGEFPRTILVTSAVPGEGKTMTSVGLATTLAAAGVRVILVDGDLRRPMIATIFGVTGGTRGLETLLLRRGKPETTLVRAPGHPANLMLLLASPEHGHLIDLLQRSRVEAVLELLRPLSDVIIVDSPPLTEVSDALTLADVVDTVIVAVRLGHTRRDKLNELRRVLVQRGISPAGFVVTRRRRSRRTSYYSSSATTPAEPTPVEAAVSTTASRRRPPADADPEAEHERGEALRGG